MHEKKYKTNAKSRGALEHVARFTWENVTSLLFKAMDNALLLRKNSIHNMNNIMEIDDDDDTKRDENLEHNNELEHDSDMMEKTFTTTTTNLANDCDDILMTRDKNGENTNTLPTFGWDSDDQFDTVDKHRDATLDGVDSDRDRDRLDRYRDNNRFDTVDRHRESESVVPFNNVDGHSDSDDSFKLAQRTRKKKRQNRITTTQEMDNGDDIFASGLL